MPEQRSHVESFEAALGALQLQPEDDAVVQLGREYASRLDVSREAASRLGPAYLAVLTSLGMTPQARAAITGKGAQASDRPAGPLDDLRRARLDRLNRASAMDAASS